MAEAKSEHIENGYPPNYFFLWWIATSVGAFLGGWFASVTFGYIYIEAPLLEVLGYALLGSTPLALSQLLALRVTVERLAPSDFVKSKRRLWLWFPASLALVFSFFYTAHWFHGLNPWLEVIFSYAVVGIIQGYTLCYIFRIKLFFSLIWIFMTVVGIVLGILPLSLVLLGDPDPIVYWIAYGLGMGFSQGFVYAWMTSIFVDRSGWLARLMDKKVATIAAITISLLMFVTPVVKKTIVEYQEAREQALISIIKAGDIEKVSKLIAEGRDLTIRDSHGVPALFYASNTKYYEIVDLMISNSIDVSALNGERLIMESAAGDVEAVKVSISYGADLSVKRPRDGQTALMEASRRGYTKIVELLKEAGAKQ